MGKHTIKISPDLMRQVEEVAKQMNMDGQKERRFQVSDTPVQFWLIRANTEEANRRAKDGAAILTEMFDVDGEKFFLARR